MTPCSAYRSAVINLCGGCAGLLAPVVAAIVTTGTPIVAPSFVSSALAETLTVRTVTTTVTVRTVTATVASVVIVRLIVAATEQTD
jgi:hypothetical protein